MVPRLRASFRWYVRFLQRKVTERALQKDGNGDGPAAGVMCQTILSVESDLKQIDNAIAVAKSAWIFPSRRNPGRHVSRVNNAHDRLCEKAQAAGVELNLVLYDFRHTFATRMAEEGSTSRRSRKSSAIARSASSGATFIRRLSTRRALCSAVG